MCALSLQITTWDKPSLELYDCESNQYKEQNFILKENGILYRNEENQIFFDETFKEHNNRKLLLRVKKLNGAFALGDQMRDLWIPIKNQILLKENDILKFGKRDFKVVSLGNRQELGPNQAYCCQVDTFDSVLLECSTYDTQCRICLDCSSNYKNPLLSLCKCMGSAKYVHYECLKKWLQDKIKIKQQEYIILINSKSIKCEICLTFYPPTIYTDSNIFVLYDLSIFNLKKIIYLEDLENNEILVLNFEETETLTLGRSNDNQITLNDITISRKHAELKFVENGVLLKDLGSKFGTLKKVQSELILFPQDKIYLQSGRSRITVHHKIKQRTFRYFCCGE